ncbi:MAG: hypothetical protein DRR16_21145 [Candidatus Parabeggiatoa sp. nov. 3]|nr:MAG: hypothetical protein DRR00_25520 [Gammaproteobacteria bacterium]RKZ60209.1 MAG: hypothetical protein DRQ99_22470 [Gammaproteobacteria bacterium]RKZ81852.1 MAG: hypothetical protein DRR16_21145 [Gammaproteobacteria bacterium]
MLKVIANNINTKTTYHPTHPEIELLFFNDLTTIFVLYQLGKCYNNTRRNRLLYMKLPIGMVSQKLLVKIQELLKALKVWLLGCQAQ